MAYHADSSGIRMRRGAFLPAVKLVVALPDHLPVFIVGMPYLGAVPAPAVPAFYLSGENAHAAVPVLPRPPRLHQCLDAVKDARLYDGRMVLLHIILRHLALIDFSLLRKEIHPVDLMAQGAAFAIPRP